MCRKCRPLWAFEEITSKVHHIKSAESLELLLNYFVRIFTESLPLCHIVQRWAREAMHLALSCSSRHYAGRSFQVRLSVSLSVCLCVCLPSCHIVQRWAREAMHLALSCSSRHYAGRSFQVRLSVSLSVCPSVCLFHETWLCSLCCLGSYTNGFFTFVCCCMCESE